jgi:hypothetical protein
VAETLSKNWNNVSSLGCSFAGCKNLTFWQVKIVLCSYLDIIIRSGLHWLECV